MSMIAAFQDNVPELPASGKSRVAVLLLTLGAPGTSRLLKHFSASEIKLLKESAAGLQSVTPEQIAELVDEFQDAFKKAPGLDAPSQQMTNLRVYAGTDHPHEAQQPQVLDVKSLNPKNTRTA